MRVLNNQSYRYLKIIAVHRHTAFSLIEVLVSMSILILICLVAFTLIDSTQKIWRQTSSRTEQFREARRAFERITQRLSQATLNTYWDYVDASGNPRTTANASTFKPHKYARQSELRYIQLNSGSLSAPRGGVLHGQSVFFQAPLGETKSGDMSNLNTVVNTTGFYIEKGTDADFKPPFILFSKERYRLYELNEPSERLSVYSYTSGNSSYNGTEWFAKPLQETSYTSRLADNIVAMVFLAEYPDGNTITKSHLYSSAPVAGPVQPVETHNLPPAVRVTIIALDEISARRVQDVNITLIDAVDEDTLEDLVDQLSSLKLNFRKFESVVLIGASKWSTQ
jgi:uncharacterized protein (TIGR02599 family)